MEPRQRMEMIDLLLVEATQHIQTLESAMAAQDVSRQASQHDVIQGTPEPQAQYTLQAEKDWWEKAHQGLTVVRNAFEQIAQSEQQRGVIARGAGA
jgi:hypothetical protein